MGKCMKLRSKGPCMPVASTVLVLMAIFTPLGTLIDSSWHKVFMATPKKGRHTFSQH